MLKTELKWFLFADKQHQGHLLCALAAPKCEGCRINTCWKRHSAAVKWVEWKTGFQLCNVIFNDIIVLHNVHTISKQFVAPWYKIILLMVLLFCSTLHHRFCILSYSILLFLHLGIFSIYSFSFFHIYWNIKLQIYSYIYLICSGTLSPRWVHSCQAGKKIKQNHVVLPLVLIVLCN